MPLYFLKKELLKILLSNTFVVVEKLKVNIVAVHLRGMRPTPSRQKDAIMLREKLKL